MRVAGASVAILPKELQMNKLPLNFVLIEDVDSFSWV